MVQDDFVASCEVDKDGRPVGSMKVYHRLVKELDEKELVYRKVCKEMEKCRKDRSELSCIGCHAFYGECHIRIRLNKLSSDMDLIHCDIVALAREIIDYYEKIEKTCV